MHSHIVKTRGVLRAQELDLPPNSESRIELVDTAGEVGLYRLVPHTGRTHQLRLHMARIGAPIVNDPFYPELRDVDRGDFTAPLQLLAAELAFEDPVDGEASAIRQPAPAGGLARSLARRLAGLVGVPPW